MKRWLPALVAFLVALVALVPAALTLPLRGDEVEFAYISSYYGSKIAHGDFSETAGTNSWLDPGWFPGTYWTLTQPMGTRYLYALAMGVTQAVPPDLPRIKGLAPEASPLTRLSDRTRTILRLTGVFLASVGLGLLAYRLTWPALAAIVLFLVIPHVPADLSRGWAEGPLLFGFGISAAAWGTRWFAPACGIAAAFKLTALPLWLLAFRHGLGRSRYQHVAGFMVAWLVWTATEIPAWFYGGPFYLGVMLRDRWVEFNIQSSYADPNVGGGLFGHYFPTRYLWPFELALLLAACVLAPRVWNNLRAPAITRALDLVQRWPGRQPE